MSTDTSFASAAPQAELEDAQSPSSETQSLASTFVHQHRPSLSRNAALALPPNAGVRAGVLRRTQQTAGNRAVQRTASVRQRTVTVSDPADPLEREATRAADVVVSRQVSAPEITGRLGRETVARSVDDEAQGPAPQDIPADVNLARFNPMDIRNRLLDAIDQTEVQWTTRKRHVNFQAVVTALSDLTAEEVQEVERRYLAYEKRSLRYDLFGGGDSGVPTDLTQDQRIRLTALLGGTRPSEPAAAGAEGLGMEALDLSLKADLAKLNKLDAEAATLHALLHGGRGKADVEQVMVILRRSAADNTDLQNAYQRLYNVPLSTDIARLREVDKDRALLLLAGEALSAEALKIEEDRKRIGAIDAEIARLRGEDDFLTESKIFQLRNERKTLIEDIEQRVRQAAEEARKGELQPGAEQDAADLTPASSAATVLGDTERVAATVGGANADVIRALASDDPVTRVAAKIRQSSAAGTLKGPEITAALRSLRDEAQERVVADVRAEMLADVEAGREPAAVTAEDLELRTQMRAAEYFSRLGDTYNALAVVSFDKVLAITGGIADKELNQLLVAGHGVVDEVAELELALRGGRKDLATAKRVLEHKSAAQIQVLKQDYALRTLKAGQPRSLDYDLFGEGAVKAGATNPDWDFINAKFRGKATGTDRLLLEDYMQRPQQEGGIAEVEYLVGRAEREYQYTIDNGGATGWWRDQWGNEVRTLLDDTIKTVRRLHKEYMSLVAQDPGQAESDRARELIRQLHLARATIRGDRAAYERETEALRGTLEFVASLAVQAALMGALGPVFAALGTLARSGAVAVRIAVWTAKTSLATATNIAANALTNPHYGADSLKGDLLGGFGGGIGASLAGKLLGPVASRIEGALGAKCPPRLRDLAKRAGSDASGLERDLVNDEIIALVKAVGGAQGAALAQGESLGFDPDTFAKMYIAGKMSDKFITEPIGKRLESAPKMWLALPAPHAEPKATVTPTPVADIVPTAAAVDPIVPAPESAPSAVPTDLDAPSVAPVRTPAADEGGDAPPPSRPRLSETPEELSASDVERGVPEPPVTGATPVKAIVTSDAAEGAAVEPKVRGQKKSLSSKELEELEFKFQEGTLTDADIARLAADLGTTPEDMRAQLTSAEVAHDVLELRRMAAGGGLVENEIRQMPKEETKQPRRPRKKEPVTKEERQRKKDEQYVKASQRAIARKAYGKMLYEALTDPEKHMERSLGMRALTEASMGYLTESQKRSIRKTGKLPKGFEFHHLMTVAAFPEFAHLPEVGLGLPRDVHHRVGHGGDTTRPLEVLTFLDPDALIRPSFLEAYDPAIGKIGESRMGVIRESRGRMEWHEEQAAVARQSAAKAERRARAAAERGEQGEERTRLRKARKLAAEAADHDLKARKYREALPELARITAAATPEQRRDLGRQAKIPEPEPDSTAEEAPASSQPEATPLD